jgi:hypothetical protein
MNACKMTGLGMALCAGAAAFTTSDAKADTVGLTSGFQNYSIGSLLVGKINVQQAANGDLTITLLQGINDNTYGTSTNAAMWGSKTHQFTDLLGSDKAEFKIFGAGSTALLDVSIDYMANPGAASLSWTSVNGLQTKTYGSGYGSSGWLSTSKNDGSLNSGNAKYILDFDTTITDNLNQSPAYYGFTTNSPVGDPNWNNVNGYTLKISGQIFTDNNTSFRVVDVPVVHDSPQGSFVEPGVPSSVPLPSAATAGLGLFSAMGGMGLVRRSRRRKAE